MKRKTIADMSKRVRYQTNTIIVFSLFGIWLIFLSCLLFHNRADFERNGLSSLITVSVRDIQGEGFPEEHEGRVDAVFLDLPQPWLAVPSASKCLKPDAVLCSFSPCIEQVQRTCETLRQSFSGLSFIYFYMFFLTKQPVVIGLVHIWSDSSF